MSTMIAGADAIERIALHYQDLMNAHAALKELGGIEQARAEMEPARDNAKRDAEDAKKEADTAKAEAEKIAANNNDAIDLATARVNEMLATANADAHRIVSEAKSNAEAIIADAKTKADELTFTTGVTVANMQAKLDDMNAEMERAATARNAAKEELAELEARIAAARETIQKVMEA